MTARPFRATAQHFLVRRYGKSVNWRCSAREIAEATGITEAVVRATCRKFGYRLNADNLGREFVMPVDSYFRLTRANLIARY